MADGIDWAALRARIAEGPFAPVVPPKPQPKAKTEEEVSEYREKELARQKAYREANPEKCHAAEKRWRMEHPEECKEKRRRNYNKHKDDQEWRAHRVEKQRQYKERLKADPVRYAAFLEKKREYRKRKREEKLMEFIAA